MSFRIGSPMEMVSLMQYLLIIARKPAGVVSDRLLRKAYLLLLFFAGLRDGFREVNIDEFLVPFPDSQFIE